MTYDDILLEAQEAMEKAVSHTLHEFSKLHTGKASPGMVESIHVHVTAYDSSMPVRDIAAVTTPDPRSIVIQPWDKGALKDIEKAIQTANLGFNPVIQGSMIRVAVPDLSGERRQELARSAHTMAEDGRIGVRHARRVAMDHLKKLLKNHEISEDDEKRHEKEIQEQTDHHIEEINSHLKSKEEDLTTV